MENGLVHIYCGNGKGKTTASIGLAVRCKGRGFKVLYCCFLKNTCSGEHSVMQNIDIQKCDFFDKFCFCMNEKESAVAKEKTKEYFEQAISKAKNYDMIILDEILDAVDFPALLCTAVTTTSFNLKSSSLNVKSRERFLLTTMRVSIVSLPTYCTVSLAFPAGTSGKV